MNFKQYPDLRFKVLTVGVAQMTAFGFSKLCVITSLSDVTWVQTDRHNFPEHERHSFD